MSQADSIFRYDIGANHSSVNRLDYVPTFTLGSSVLESKLEAVCGKSQFCRYDFHKTNNETAARSTKDAEEDFTETDKGTIPGRGLYCCSRAHNVHHVTRVTLQYLCES